MKIIRDEGLMGNGMTTCLGIDWGIRRCNIKGCAETMLGAIIAQVPDTPIFGVCEEHYQMYFSKPMNVHIELDFNSIGYVEPDDEYAWEWRLNG